MISSSLLLLFSSQVRLLICCREYLNRITSLTPSCTLPAWVRRGPERNIAGIRPKATEGKKGAEAEWSAAVKEAVRAEKTEKGKVAERVKMAGVVEVSEAPEAEVEAETWIQKPLFTSSSSSSSSSSSHHRHLCCNPVIFNISFLTELSILIKIQFTYFPPFVLFQHAFPKV